MHTIRLRHPWKCEPLETGMLWSRSFNWPAGLTPRETAQLVIEGLPETAIVRLGKTTLASSPAGTFQITNLLATQNKLTIELVDSSPLGQIECPFEVRLEIDEG